MNHHLASAGHSDQLITDLATDMADGITLLQLVQTLGVCVCMCVFAVCMRPNQVETVFLHTLRYHMMISVICVYIHALQQHSPLHPPPPPPPPSPPHVPSYTTITDRTAKEDLPKHFPNPMMRVQKLENLQMCVQSLQDRGVPIKGIHADGERKIFSIGF